MITCNFYFFSIYKGVIRNYPDATLDQLTALVLLRGDVGKNDARSVSTVKCF